MHPMKHCVPTSMSFYPGLDLILSSPGSLPRLLIYAESQQHIHIDLGTWALPPEIVESVTEPAKSQE